MYCLVQMTSNDYADYLKIHRKIKYSYVEYGHENESVSETLVRLTQRRIKDEKSFLEAVYNPRKKLYFLQQQGQIYGIAEVSFIENLCYIHEFAVLKSGEGYGTILYQEILKLMKEHEAEVIELWCPWKGGERFWRKKGLLVKHGFVLWKRV